MVADFIIGDLRTGRRLVDLPVASGSWKQVIMDAETMSCTLDVRDSAFRTLDLRTSTATARNFLAAVEDDRVVAAGPIWTRRYDRDGGKLTLGAKGMMSIFDHRSIMPLIAATLATSQWIIPDPTTPSKTMPNPALRTSFTNLSLGTIAKKLIQQAMSWTGGNLPIVYGADVPDLSADNQRTYEGTAFKIVGDAIQQLMEVEKGPEIRLSPRFTADKLGVEWVFEAGTPTQPLLVQSFEPVWDLSAEEPTAYGLEISEDGSALNSLAWYTGGREADTFLLARAYNDLLINAGYPLLEMVNSQHTSVSVPSTLQKYADAAVRSGVSATETWTMSAEIAPLDEDGHHAGPWLEEYTVGSFARIKIDKYNEADDTGDWYMLGGANSRHRIVGLGGNADSDQVAIAFAPEVMA